MSANPSRHDRWPPPKHWRHVWVRLTFTPTPAPYPGLVIWWRHKGSVEMGTRRHIALTVFIEEDAFDMDARKNGPRYRMEWLDSKHLRPVRSDYNAAWSDRHDHNMRCEPPRSFRRPDLAAQPVGVSSFLAA